MSLVNKLVKNSLSNSAAFVVEAVVAFMMMPFVVGQLGDSAYGIWILVNALTGYLGLFKMGFRPSINKHVAEYKALGDVPSMKRFMGASLHIYMYVSLLIIITAVTVSYFLPQIFSVGDEFGSIFQILVLFAGVHSAFSLIGTTYGGVISGYQRYEINAGIEIGVIVIRALLIVAFLPEFPDLYTMAAAHFSITILGFLVTIVAAKKIAPLDDLPIVKKPGKDVLKIILKYNSISFSIAALSILINFVDSIVIGIILPLSVVTHYGVGDRLVKYCLMFLNVSTKVIAPAISELNATNKKDTLNQVLIGTHKASCLVVFPILLCLFVQGGLFIELWMGQGYNDSYQIMQVLAISALFIAPSQSVNSYLYGIGKHKFLLYILAVETAISLPLCIILGKIYGAVGVAIGISVPRAVLRGLFLPLMIGKIAEHNIFGAFFIGKIRVLFACVPFIILLWWFKENFALDSWFIYASQLAAACVLYLVSVYLVSFNGKEKQQIKSLAQIALGKSK